MIFSNFTKTGQNSLYKREDSNFNMFQSRSAAKMQSNNRLLPTIHSPQKLSRQMQEEQQNTAYNRLLKKKKDAFQTKQLSKYIDYLHTLIEERSLVKQYSQAFDDGFDTWKELDSLSSQLVIEGKKNDKLLHTLQDQLRTVTSERDVVSKNYSALQKALQQVKFDKWGNEDNLRRNISSLEDQIKQLSFSPESANAILMQLPPHNKRVHQIHTLVNRNFQRFDQLIFVLKTRLANLQKYKKQEQVESRFGDVPTLLESHDKLLEENKILKRREVRFSRGPLLKRRALALAPVPFLHSLIFGLQNELSACMLELESYKCSDLEMKKENLVEHITTEKEKQNIRSHEVNIDELLVNDHDNGDNNIDRDDNDTHIMENQMLKQQIARLQVEVRELRARAIVHSNNDKKNDNDDDDDENNKQINNNFTNQRHQHHTSVGNISLSALKNKSQDHLLMIIGHYSDHLRSAEQAVLDQSQVYETMTEELLEKRKKVILLESAIRKIVFNAPMLYNVIIKDFLKKEDEVTFPEEQQNNEFNLVEANQVINQLSLWEEKINDIMEKLEKVRKERLADQMSINIPGHSVHSSGRKNTRKNSRHDIQQSTRRKHSSRG